ncbi:hypothetical protein FSP39_023543 [Pinctada imbricata]|uniref:Uncharacterized protein n=1 Tax=Pinctada imbricata TaxID=66713 RepID=A0AA88YF01_PINIB|nr:hypothetical protein FSP39_023543 [Pinctada imbricata]
MLSAEAEGNMMGMSEEAVWSTGVRNELEKWKLENEIGQITSDEKLNYRSKQKELRQLKDDITLMIAEGFVYKTHCFGKYDPFKTPTERENFTWSDSTEAKTAKKPNYILFFTVHIQKQN